MRPAAFRLVVVDLVPRADPVLPVEPVRLVAPAADSSVLQRRAAHSEAVAVVARAAAAVERMQSAQ